MDERKNHNRIIFLTTLSVYLGLVLVGATPQVLAQNSKEIEEPNKISIVVPGEGYVFTFDLNPILKLNELSAKESSSIKVSGKLILQHQKLTNWDLLNASGNQKIVDYISKEFFTPAELDPPTLPFFLGKEFTQSIEVDKGFITISRSTKFDDAKTATKMADIFRRINDYAKSPEADKKIAGNLYVINTEALSANNQVLIVTRLPRGSLDALDKQGAKADDK